MAIRICLRFCWRIWWSRSDGNISWNIPRQGINVTTSVQVSVMVTDNHWRSGCRAVVTGVSIHGFRRSCVIKRMNVNSLQECFIRKVLRRNRSARGFRISITSTTARLASHGCWTTFVWPILFWFPSKYLVNWNNSNPYCSHERCNFCNFFISFFSFLYVWDISLHTLSAISRYSSLHNNKSIYLFEEIFVWKKADNESINSLFYINCASLSLYCRDTICGVQSGVFCVFYTLYCSIYMICLLS